MNYQELATKIHQLLELQTFTRETENEFLELDEKVRAFVKNSTPTELQAFRKICYGLESFVMIVSGIEHNR